MFDILPFPNITATDAKERTTQIVEYLFQFREELEFLLTNITTENLSPELRSRIASYKTTDEVFTDAQNEQLKQMAGHGGASVSDVMNSSAFLGYASDTTKYIDQSEADAKKYTDDKLVEAKFITSGSQTTKSDESGGLNVYTFTRSDGSEDTFEVRNGEKGEAGIGNINIYVDYETGELIYTSQGE